MSLIAVIIVPKTLGCRTAVRVGTNLNWLFDDISRSNVLAVHKILIEFLGAFFERGKYNYASVFTPGNGTVSTSHEIHI